MHKGTHLANWPGGSGHCFCMCAKCWVWLSRGPKGESRGGQCVCRDCPCGGYATQVQPSLVTLGANNA